MRSLGAIWIGGWLLLLYAAYGAFEALRSKLLAFDLHAEPAMLFPDLTPGGRLNGSGQLAIERNPELALDGKVTIEQDGDEVVLEMANVAKARLVPDYEAILAEKRNKSD